MKANHQHSMKTCCTPEVRSCSRIPPAPHPRIRLPLLSVFVSLFSLDDTSNPFKISASPLIGLLRLVRDIWAGVGPPRAKSTDKSARADNHLDSYSTAFACHLKSYHVHEHIEMWLMGYVFHTFLSSRGSAKFGFLLLANNLTCQSIAFWVQP